MADRVLRDQFDGDGLDDALVYELTMIDLGLVDPDEPLPAHSFQRRRSMLRQLRAEFTPKERMEIRLKVFDG